MKAIPFPEQNTEAAKNQPQYRVLPCFVAHDSPNGEVVMCLQMNWKERLKVLFTGKIWCSMMCFGNPITPSFHTVNKSDVLISKK